MKKIYFLLFLISFIQLNLFAQNFWEPTNGPFAGKITSIAVCPDEDIFAAEADGLFYSNDDGATWVKKNTPLGSIISLTSNDSGDIFIIKEFIWSASHYSDYNIIRSTDKGNSWTYLKFSYPGSVNLNHVITITPNGYLFIGRKDKGILRSTNNSESWLEVNNSIMTKNIVCLTSNSNGYIFAGTTMGVFRSTDYGDNWVRLNTGLTNTDVRTIYVNSSGNIFTGTYGGGVYRSTNNGMNWTQINNNLTIPYISSLAVTTDGKIFAGTYENGVFRSTDNGDYWTQNNFGLTDNHINCIANSGNAIFLGNNGAGIYRSTNSGDNWTHVGLNKCEILTLGINEKGDIFTSIYGVGISRSTDNGNTWTNKNSGLPIPYIRAIAVHPNGCIFAATAGPPLGGGIFKSSDNGDNWSLSGLLGGGVSCLAINSVGNIFAGTGGGVFRSTDNGNNWKQIPFVGPNVQCLAINSVGNIFAGNYWGVYCSKDNGNNWQEVLNVDSITYGLTTMAINKNDDLIVGLANDKVFRSTDNGNKWEELTIPFSFSIGVITCNSDGDIFAGPSISSDNGYSWIKIDSGLPTGNFTSLAFNKDGYVFAGTTTAGVYRSTSPTTSVKNEIENISPSIFSLSQNFPNPFNPYTRIKYSIPYSSFVTLKVYDLLGREIATLVNGEKPVGNYIVEFSPDGDGSGLPSGIYFYKLQAGSYTSVKKMILMK